MLDEDVTSMLAGCFTTGELDLDNRILEEKQRPPPILGTS